MGCTPSIHVSQTGVVYCRESEDSNSPHPASLNATFHAGHTHVIRGDTSVITTGVGIADEDRVVATTAITSTAGSGSAGVVSSVFSSAGRINSKRFSGAGGSNLGILTVSSSEAETQTSQQNMKVNIC